MQVETVLQSSNEIRRQFNRVNGGIDESFGDVGEVLPLYSRPAYRHHRLANCVTLPLRHWDRALEAQEEPFHQTPSHSM